MTNKKVDKNQQNKLSPKAFNEESLDKTILIKNQSNHKNSEVSFSGWVYKIRSSGKIAFLEFRDGTGDIQAVVEKSNVSKEVWDLINNLTIESSLIITGFLKEEPRSPFGYEININNIELIHLASEYPISNKEHGPDFLLDNRHLWLRSPKQRAILKIRNQLFLSITNFLHEENFTRIDTPIFQPVSCEDTSELFEVNYYGEKTYLTQSGQLYLEASIFALGRTYDFGPVFRAEKSKTRKHLIEFWMMDAELPFTRLDSLIDFQEKFLKRMVLDCLNNCKNEFKILARNTEALEKANPVTG